MGRILFCNGYQAEKISTLVKAANVEVESYWPALFAKLLEKRSVEDLITNVGSGLHRCFSKKLYATGLKSKSLIVDGCCLVNV